MPIHNEKLWEWNYKKIKLRSTSVKTRYKSHVIMKRWALNNKLTRMEITIWHNEFIFTIRIRQIQYTSSKAENERRKILPCLNKTPEPSHINSTTDNHTHTSRGYIRMSERLVEHSIVTSNAEREVNNVSLRYLEFYSIHKKRSIFS